MVSAASRPEKKINVVSAAAAAAAVLLFACGEADRETRTWPMSAKREEKEIAAAAADARRKEQCMHVPQEGTIHMCKRKKPFRGTTTATVQNVRTL